MRFVLFLKQALIDTTVPKPVSGTLSGHAAGEPFDKHVLKFIKKKYPNETFRQYEYLNRLYKQNPKARTIADRWSLIKLPSLAFLLNRGKTATQRETGVSPPAISSASSPRRAATESRHQSRQALREAQ